MSEHVSTSCTRLLAVLVALSAALGCRNGSEIATRYELETRIWSAEQFRKRSVSDPLREKRDEFLAALASYEDILADDRFRTPIRDEKVGRDVRKLLLAAKIARAELYFVELEKCEGVTYRGSLDDAYGLLFSRRFGLGLERAGALYTDGLGDSLVERCAIALADVMEDPGFWSGGGKLGDTLLCGPVALARACSRGGGGRAEHSGGNIARLARDFYSRIAETWPDTPLAEKALLQRAELLVLREELEAALRDLEGVLARLPAGERRGDVLLRKGLVLAYGLGREEEARVAFETAISESPGRPCSRRAAVYLAELEGRSGNEAQAFRRLRDVETDPSTPRGIAALAMFVRALHLDRTGNGPEAEHVLRQASRLDPSAPGGVASLLALIARRKAENDTAGLENASRETAELCARAIGSASGDPRKANVLVDVLIESQVLAEEPRRAAELLSMESRSWSGDVRCVGFYKAALVYLRLAHDEEDALRTMRKSLDLCPRSRYAWVVRKALQSVSPTSEEP